MKRFIIPLITCAWMMAAVVAGAQPAMSGHERDRRDARRDEWRMQGGAGSGLTRGERVRTRAAQRRVQRLQRWAMADGVVTWWERRRIVAARTELRRLVYRLRHDVDRRGWGVEDWGVS